MEWLADYGFSLSGIPWWAAFALAIATFFATKGIDAALKWRKANQEERQYEDGETKEGYKALIAELKEQVKELKGTHATILAELKEVRAAHINCEIGQAELRGDLNVMKEKIAALERHEAATKQQVELNKQKAAELEAKLPTA
ncbi:MAG TPA: hypothetical protein VF443_15615 [Nitrospira sp.]